MVLTTPHLKKIKNVTKNFTRPKDLGTDPLVQHKQWKRDFRFGFKKWDREAGTGLLWLRWRALVNAVMNFRVP
jgi:hypothetical protein